MKLIEFQGNGSLRLSNVVTVLRQYLGNLEKVGGRPRVYVVDGAGQVAVAYVRANLSGIGLGWERDVPELGVRTIYFWHVFDVSKEPDYAVDLPNIGDFATMAPQIVALLKAPQMGKIPIQESLVMEATRTTAAEFIRMAQMDQPDKVSNLTLPDMIEIARNNGVQIPSEIRSGFGGLKVDVHHWNLSGESSHDVNKQLSSTLGAPVEAPPVPEVSPEYADTLNLAKVKSLGRLASQNRVYLMGRKANGAFFKIPGIEEITGMIERMLTNTLDAGVGRQGMDEQFELLRERIRLVAGGRSNFIKSLLITGSPSSGKTFSVMKTIKDELKLHEGKDYIVKKGNITPVSLFRVMIEQINGMLIFDDCDSVVEDKKAINMLKGALDTEPVREISYDVKGTINTAVMAPEERQDFVEAISRIFRGKPEQGDIEGFEHFLKPRKATPDNSGGEDGLDDDDAFAWHEPGDEEDEEGEAGYKYDIDKLHELQIYFANHMPNKIDFKGRIIFISNMEESEWDSAIISRAFTINMSFSDKEMLDYIDKIKGHFNADNLTDEEKQEVMDYLRELWTSGKLRKPVNFRLVQQCFDLRLTNMWRQLMAML